MAITVVSIAGTTGGTTNANKTLPKAGVNDGKEYIPIGIVAIIISTVCAFIIYRRNYIY